METYYTEEKITQAVVEYADYHGLDAGDVDVCRNFVGDTVVGIRLSPGDGTECRGIDEQYGTW